MLNNWWDFFLLCTDWNVQAGIVQTGNSRWELQAKIVEAGLKTSLQQLINPKKIKWILATPDSR